MKKIFLIALFLLASQSVYAQKAASTGDTLSFNQKEFIIENDSVKIGGTLTWPLKDDVRQLVIIISGSGLQDRNGANPLTDFEPYAELANGLTKKSIAVFRYDDRNVDQSTGNVVNATLDTLASDVDAIISRLSTGSDYNFEEIILLGHSQGGLVAGKVAVDNEKVNKLILMASPGITLMKIMRFQLKRGFRRANIDSSLIEKEISGRENLMNAIAHDGNVEKAQQQYKHIFKTVQMAAGLDSTQALALAQRQVSSLTRIFRSALMQSLFYYNPTTGLQQLNIPVLVLFGGKDTQVPVEMNKAPIKKALEEAGVPYKVKIFEEANHLFQDAKTGSFREYDALKNQFVNRFIQTIAKWIKKD